MMLLEKDRLTEYQDQLKPLTARHINTFFQVVRFCHVACPNLASGCILQDTNRKRKTHMCKQSAVYAHLHVCIYSYLYMLYPCVCVSIKVVLK